MKKHVTVYVCWDDSGHVYAYNIDLEREQIYKHLMEKEQCDGLLTDSEVEYPFDYEEMDTPTFEGILQQTCQSRGIPLLIKVPI